MYYGSTFDTGIIYAFRLMNDLDHNVHFYANDTLEFTRILDSGFALFIDRPGSCEDGDGDHAAEARCMLVAKPWSPAAAEFY